MFISVLDLFKIGVGPSSSHTMGPMVAAVRFRNLISESDQFAGLSNHRIKCTLRGSLAHTGHGHSTDKAIILGLHGYLPEQLAKEDQNSVMSALLDENCISLATSETFLFDHAKDLIFDKREPLPQHPNGMIFELINPSGKALVRKVYFSIGGGFVYEEDEMNTLEAPLKLLPSEPYPYPFDSAKSMLAMAHASDKSIADMKLENEVAFTEDRDKDEDRLRAKLDAITNAMLDCIDRGLKTEGTLPGGLEIKRRAKLLLDELKVKQEKAQIIDYLCAYAMAVNEENAAGHCVVTAPTNGAAGVIPAVWYYFQNHELKDKSRSMALARTFLLTASAIGGLIKHRSSISGAEVGCQGEVGSAAAMGAAGLCAVKGGTPEQIENAAEIALEHHLGMTCDPVNGLVQVPCIERNGFGAIKAYTAASLSLRGDGKHFMPLDACIAAMKQTGLEMSDKYKETALGGLAQSWTEC